MVELSAVIITYNEEKNIGRCLDSILPVADEIVVIDSGSSDNTIEKCKEKGARVIHHPFKGHVQQKNWAIKQAHSPYVLSLDADEELSSKLQESILKVKANWNADGYLVNRRNNYCGKWIRHSGWYPDKKLRLWDSRKGKWSGRNPHDMFVMEKEATISNLKGDLLHYTYTSIEQNIEQIQKFSTISANAKFEEGRKISLFMLIIRPPIIFLKKYILKLGIFDGYAGFIIAVLTSYNTFLKDIKLRELHRKAKENTFKR